MVQNSTYGTNHTVAKINKSNEEKGCFTLWEKLAEYDEKFGHPEKFDNNIDKTMWMSFCLTMEECPILVKEIERITGDRNGCAGVVTIDECTGEEILREFLFQLGLEKNMEDIVSHCQVRTCMMPYITSQFMPRQKGDRPEIIPKDCVNLALMGQFVETEDVVFTVETSVRTAMMAVYGLLKLDKKVIPIAPTKYDIRVIASMFRMITGNGKNVPQIPEVSPEKIMEIINRMPNYDI